MDAFDDWFLLTERHPVGSVVHARVEHWAPFGVFLDLGHPMIKGLVLVPEMRADGGCLPEHYPALGTWVTGVVVDHAVYNHQIRVSLRRPAAAPE